jgi:hypothetical protein
MHKIDTDKINIPAWPTQKHMLEKAFKDGKCHAVNHYYGEEADPDWPFGVKSWAVNPYSDNRPGAHYSWVAGFAEMWGELIRQERIDQDGE